MIYRLIFLVIFFTLQFTAHERIAILAYGSLIKLQSHSITGARLRASKFEPAPFEFPISLSPLAHKDRITAVIDTVHGSPKRVWFAVSDFTSINQAIQNLAAREGAPKLENGDYDTRYIFYARKVITNNKINWIIHDSADTQQQLDEVTIKTIIKWAQKNNFDAVLWVSCPIVAIKQTEFISSLINDPVMLKNAQYYIKLFADGPQTDFEKAIINGKNSLVKLMHKSKE